MKVAWGFVCFAALLLLATPAAAATGACWAASDEWFDSPEQGAGVCLDDVPKVACDQLAAGAEGITIEFNEGDSCEDVADDLGHGPWDGLCVFYIDILDQDVCAWVGVEPGVTGGLTVTQFCEAEEAEFEGSYLGDDGMCPVTTAIMVPAVPDAGLLVLALLLIVGGMLVAWRTRSLAAH